MGQTLTNGVYLPDEGERNCYTGLAGNWQALDNHLGNANIHVTYEDKQAWNNHIADTVKHVTAEDKAAWNGKADASALTAHTGDTTIHVTAEDKQAWNGKQDALSQTQLDAVNSGIDSSKVQQIATNTSDISSLQSGKANDSDVVHKSGAETIGGVKNFTDNISAKKIISNVAQLQINAKSSADSIAVVAGANASEGGGFWCYGKDTATGSDCRIQIYNTSKSRFERVDLVGSQFLPAPSGELDCGSTSNKWKTINGLNPSSLGMPDLSNGIDISSYITHLDKVVNNYTPPSNGWLSIRVKKTSLAHTSLMMYQTGGLLSACETTEFGISGANLPVIANQKVEIYIIADVLVSAKFFPCLGNV